MISPNTHLRKIILVIVIGTVRRNRKSAKARLNMYTVDAVFIDELREKTIIVMRFPIRPQIQIIVSKTQLMYAMCFIAGEDGGMSS